MWKNSEGEEIKKIFKKIYSQNLSNDAKDILEIALLTNSNVPSINITKEEFYIFQKNFLIKKNDLNLIKLFIEKNPDFFGRDDLINYYANHYLAKANIKKTCEIFDVIDEVISDYTSKLKIYCLVNSNQIEEALRTLIEGLDRSPGSPAITRMIVETMVAADCFDRAAEVWTKAVRLYPGGYLEIENWLNTTGRS